MSHAAVSLSVAFIPSQVRVYQIHWSNLCRYRARHLNRIKIHL